MFLKAHKGGLLAAYLTPVIGILAIAVSIILLLLVVTPSYRAAYNDNALEQATTLSSMMESTECTPKTGLTFKDVIAAGIAQEKTGTYDRIPILFGSVEEKTPENEDVTVGYCIDRIIKPDDTKTQFSFYVKYCPSADVCDSKSIKTAYYMLQFTGAKSANIVETAKIALPDGRIATAFLER